MSFGGYRLVTQLGAGADGISYQAVAADGVTTVELRDLSLLAGGESLGPGSSSGSSGRAARPRLGDPGRRYRAGARPSVRRHGMGRHDHARQGGGHRRAHNPLQGGGARAEPSPVL